MDAYIEFATAPWRARGAAELAAASERFLAEVIEPQVRPSALALVRRHRDAGDVVAIVTSTNEFVTRPIAERFGVDHLLATELERDALGAVTGRVRGVPCLREGKITRLSQWLADCGLTLDGCEAATYYGDSMNDLPLLEAVSRPVATNPAPALERIARERGWPVLKLFE
jgi:HAD superfamily hydrolase (TIGR01490 family)